MMDGIVETASGKLRGAARNAVHTFKGMGRAAVLRRCDLEAKMRTYAEYVRAREWMKDGLASLPRLLFFSKQG